MPAQQISVPATSGQGPQQQGAPWWYTPKRLLALFCGVSFLVYLDRGVIACNGVNYGIQASLHYVGLMTKTTLGELLLAATVQLTSVFVVTATRHTPQMLHCGSNDCMQACMLACGKPIASFCILH